MQTAMIVPFKNEGTRILHVAETAHEALEQGVISEAVFVNDGSVDTDWISLNNHDDIELQHTKNNWYGKGWALDLGIKRAEELGCDTAVLVDGDMHGLTAGKLEKLLAPLESGAMMSIGYTGVRRHFADLPFPLNRFGALSGLRAFRMEAWRELGDLGQAGRADKDGFNEAALNARIAKLHLPIARVALDGIGHVSKQDKTGSLPRALWGYAKTYGLATYTATRIGLEPIGSKRATTNFDELPLDQREFIENQVDIYDYHARATERHRKLRNGSLVVAGLGGMVLTGIVTGVAPDNIGLITTGEFLAMWGSGLSAFQELKRREHRTPIISDARFIANMFSCYGLEPPSWTRETR